MGQLLLAALWRWIAVWATARIAVLVSKPLVLAVKVSSLIYRADLRLAARTIYRLDPLGVSL